MIDKVDDDVNDGKGIVVVVVAVVVVVVVVVVIIVVIGVVDLGSVVVGDSSDDGEDTVKSDVVREDAGELEAINDEVIMPGIVGDNKTCFFNANFIIHS
ncbi:hypothetical protein HK100_003208 [Physocladia obscura]|uniref:Uncharacterized protein n=1 Tax=Physocladia obscura TaxID=109957 RepID=A0AAD5SVV2_9FUNG|nr:hypothetical protein HK100_003208 [Physocladia obscura]